MENKETDLSHKEANGTVGTHAIAAAAQQEDQHQVEKRTAMMIKSSPASSNLLFTQSFHFSSSDEELDEPKEVATPDLSDHETEVNNLTTESPQSSDNGGEPEPTGNHNGHPTDDGDDDRPTSNGTARAKSPPPETAPPAATSSMTSPQLYKPNGKKPDPPPRIYRRINNKTSSHLGTVPPHPPAATSSHGRETLQEAKRKTTSSSGYSSPGSGGSASLSPSASTVSSSSSSSSSFKTAADGKARPGVRSPAEESDGAPMKMSLSPRSSRHTAGTTPAPSSEPMRALPISQLVARQDSQASHVSSSSASSSRVDYTADVRLPSGNTICLVEDASSLARHKQRSVASSAAHLHHHHQGAASHQAVRRRHRHGAEGWKSSGASFDHDATTSESSRRRRQANSEQRRSVPTFPFAFARSNGAGRKGNPQQQAAEDWSYISEKDFSASLANLARASANDQDLMPPPPVPGPASSGGRPFSTVSVATGRRMSELADNAGASRTSTLPGANIPKTSSLWSLNFTGRKSNSFASNNSGGNEKQQQRRPSLKNRLKGAFSFQNIRRAMSMERVAEEGTDGGRSGKLRSSKTFELSERIEEQQQQTTEQEEEEAGEERRFGGGGGGETLRKAPSISSIISTVRMRKRKSKLRRNGGDLQQRNTIAIDTFSLENIADQHRLTSTARTPFDIGRPNYFRPIGRVLNIDAIEGTVLVEIAKPPSGPYGFYLGRRGGLGNNQTVYISSLNDGYPEKMYAGLMRLGDEVTEINGIGVDGLSLDVINDMIVDSENVRLRVRPAKVNRV